MTDNIITVTLAKPIMGPEGEEISTLSFREPTGSDIERCGNPVHLDLMSAEPKTTFNAKSMSAMLSALSGQVPPVIGKLSGNDWNSAAWAVSGFFIPILANVS